MNVIQVMRTTGDVLRMPTVSTTMVVINAIVMMDLKGTQITTDATVNIKLNYIIVNTI